MEILIIAAIIVFITILASRMEKQTIEAVPTKTCDIHAWVWEQQPGTDIEYLRCTKCKLTPGEVVLNIQSRE